MVFFQNKGAKNSKSFLKKQQIISSVALSEVGISLRDGPLTTDIRIVNLHPSIGKHPVIYINQNCFDSFGGTPPRKICKIIIKKTNWHLFFF